MTHDTAMAYLDTLVARDAELNEAMLSLRRQTIRGTIYLMITDPTHREEAIIAAHAAGLFTSPMDTLKEDLLTAVKPWIPSKKVTNEK